MADTNRSSWLDILFLLLMSVPIVVFHFFGAPYERGFYCDDQSLMHPFHSDTIPTESLVIVGVIIPAGLILWTEYNLARGSRSTTMRWGLQIPEWLEKAYRPLLLLAFGSAAGQLFTDIAKYSIGRLRPHFFAVCQPLMPDGTTCDHSINRGRYIVDMECVAIGSSADMLREARLSFPSGHSSYGTFAMVFCMIYLQHRMHCPRSRLCKHVLQFTLALIAWITALSRISDYKHHWSDVLVGVLLGTANAAIVMNFIGLEDAIEDTHSATHSPMHRRNNKRTR